MTTVRYRCAKTGGGVSGGAVLPTAGRLSPSPRENAFRSPTRLCSSQHSAAPRLRPRGRSPARGNAVGRPFLPVPPLPPPLEKPCSRAGKGSHVPILQELTKAVYKQKHGGTIRFSLTFLPKFQQAVFKENLRPIFRTVPW